MRRGGSGHVAPQPRTMGPGGHGPHPAGAPFGACGTPAPIFEGCQLPKTIRKANSGAGMLENVRMLISDTRGGR